MVLCWTTRLSKVATDFLGRSPAPPLFFGNSDFCSGDPDLPLVRSPLHFSIRHIPTSQLPEVDSDHHSIRRIPRGLEPIRCCIASSPSRDCLPGVSGLLEESSPTPREQEPFGAETMVGEVALGHDQQKRSLSNLAQAHFPGPELHHDSWQQKEAGTEVLVKTRKPL